MVGHIEKHILLINILVITFKNQRRILLITTEGDGNLLIMKSDRSISVLIRVKNEERWVGHCIQSVLDFIDDPEIIIINNNSNDNSLNVINHFKR